MVPSDISIKANHVSAFALRDKQVSTVTVIHPLDGIGVAVHITRYWWCIYINSSL